MQTKLLLLAFCLFLAQSTFASAPTIAAGGTHSLAIASDGLGLATGNNSNGQLGNGTVADSATFEAVTNLTDLVSVEGGDAHSLAVKADGTVWAWGLNGTGRLGDGTTSQRTAPVQVTNLTDVLTVAAGGSHSLALKTNGTVWAWGLGTSGQLGNGTNLNQTTRVQVNGLSNIIAVSAGDTHSLALDNSGKVWAWGNNANGRLGDLTIGHRFSPVQVLSVSNITAIAAGGSHNLALDNTGHVWAWGLNSSGQLGNNTITTSTNAVQVTNLNSVVNLAAGNVHSLALLSNGTVRAWGGNASGQLGNGTLTTSKTNVVVQGATGIVALAAGDLHSLGLQADGTIVVWGDHKQGQLGTGEFVYRSLADFVTGITNAVSISAGASHTVARLADSSTVAWGNNANGQLGNGTTTDNPWFGTVSNLTGVISSEGGDAHSLAVASDGTAWAWGVNTSGRLGDGTATQRTVPVRVTNLTDVLTVAAGDGFSLALKTNGTVWAWGLGTSGQLGNGTNLNQTTRVQVSGLSNVIALAAGGTHSLALDADGKVWAWGNNANGRLGDLTIGNRFSPVQVASVSNITAIAAGGSHSMALDTAGQVWAWGFNSVGQLGNGTVTSSTNAVMVTNLNSVAKIAGGNVHSLALLSNGTVRAWGGNASGQLGNGTLANQKTNVAMLGVTNAIAIAAGDLHSVALLNDGTVMVCGDSANGQLGDGNQGYNSTALEPLPPTIGDQPISQTVCEGDAVELSVFVLGTGPVSYEWRFNNAPILNGTNSVLTFNAVATNQAGGYTVIASDMGGSVTSTVAVLAMTPVWDCDSDADGLPDGWELLYFGSTTNAPSGDADGDELTNFQEYQTGTNPANADTDGDGRNDWQEKFDGTNPLDSASQATWPVVANQPRVTSGGLLARDESVPQVSVPQLGADGKYHYHLQRGVPGQLYQVFASANLGSPNWSFYGQMRAADVGEAEADYVLADSSQYQQYLALAGMLDTDGDGLTDGYEYFVSDTGLTNPDTDDDGLSDGLELELGFNPKNSHSQDSASLRKDGEWNLTAVTGQSATKAAISIDTTLSYYDAAVDLTFLFFDVSGVTENEQHHIYIKTPSLDSTDVTLVWQDMFFSFPFEDRGFVNGVRRYAVAWFGNVPLDGSVVFAALDAEDRDFDGLQDGYEIMAAQTVVGVASSRAGGLADGDYKSNQAGDVSILQKWQYGMNPLIVPSAVDSLNDGMPDWFRDYISIWFGSGAAAPWVDADGDHLPNTVELEIGSDPTIRDFWNYSPRPTGDESAEFVSLHEVVEFPLASGGASFIPSDNEFFPTVGITAGPLGVFCAMTVQTTEKNATTGIADINFQISPLNLAYNVYAPFSATADPSQGEFQKPNPVDGDLFRDILIQGTDLSDKVWAKIHKPVLEALASETLEYVHAVSLLKVQYVCRKIQTLEYLRTSGVNQPGVLIRVKSCQNIIHTEITKMVAVETRYIRHYPNLDWVGRELRTAGFLAWGVSLDDGFNDLIPLVMAYRADKRRYENNAAADLLSSHLQSMIQSIPGMSVAAQIAFNPTVPILSLLGPLGWYDGY